MNGVLSIFRREVRSFFVSPIAYFVLTGFALLGGYFFFNLLVVFNVIIGQYNMMPQKGGIDAPTLNTWVVEPFYRTLLIILVFLIPLLTMRIIAEEKKAGTFELLVTSPLSVFQIVFGKFLAVSFVIFVMCFAILVFPLLLATFGNPEILPILGGFLGVYLCAIGFASVGMAVSSFSENQIVAGISSMVTLLLLYVIHSPAEQLGGMAGDVLNYISPVMQTRDILRGVISAKSLVYFFSLISLGIFLSLRALEAHRWR